MPYIIAGRINKASKKDALEACLFLRRYGARRNALSYLEDTRTSITEIGFLLGFADTNSSRPIS